MLNRSEDGTIDRRRFTVEAALAMLSGVVITISCAAGKNPEAPTAQASPTPQPTPQASPTPEATPAPGATPTPSPAAPTPTPGPTPVADKLGAISANHGHVARITGAQLTAGGALQLDITGNATHPHTVVLSSADVMNIAANMPVSRQSSTNSGHSHTVSFN